MAGGNNDLFEKIPQKKISDRVFEQVRERIGDGRLQPGDRLPPERELTGLFAVSRSSVREAILKLECLGFVEQRHGDGTFVRSVTESPLTGVLEELIGNGEFVTDLMEIRQVLECWAAATAAQRAEDQEIARLKDCIADMRRARCTGGIGYELNIHFHKSIATAAHNLFLVHIMNTISGWIGQITGKVYADLFDDRKTSRLLIEQHQTIADAIGRRDPEAARRAMDAHLQFSVAKARQAGIAAAPL